MPALPTGTVTFLFTDIEGSTRLWEEHPEAMRVALARHDNLLHTAIDQHDGTSSKRWAMPTAPLSTQSRCSACRSSLVTAVLAQQSR
jgi:class 3 adenylate cyclase